ncbi:MAG: diaminopimelate epimerase [Victivallales bacterium]|nr:diaminopimelate epimerase [Victivallales bacterium]
MSSALAHKFIKMHGAGNDFVVCDNTYGMCPCEPCFVRVICDRRRGIGADGLVLLSSRRASQSSSGGCVQVKFFNCDGTVADMCGNGLRCAAVFARNHMGMGDSPVFATASGDLHTKVIAEGLVRIQIPLLGEPRKIDICNHSAFLVNTGVPHVVIPCGDILSVDIKKEGRAIRNSTLLAPEGANVNFICVPEKQGGPVRIRTYERGVEAETSACGTGIAAAAVALKIFWSFSSPVEFLTIGDDLLRVEFCGCGALLPESFELFLTGPAVEVFSAEINLASEAFIPFSLQRS